MNELTRIRLMMAVAAVVLIMAAAFVIQSEGINLWSMIMLVTMVAIALVALALVIRALRELRSGLPLQDERSKALDSRAGYYAFYLSMYTTLGLALVFPLLEDRDIVLSNSVVLFIVVMMMGTIHIAFSTYLKSRGRGSSA